MVFLPPPGGPHAASMVISCTSLNISFLVSKKPPESSSCRMSSSGGCDLYWSGWGMFRSSMKINAWKQYIWVKHVFNYIRTSSITIPNGKCDRPSDSPNPARKRNLHRTNRQQFQIQIHKPYLTSKMRNRNTPLN